MSISKCAAMHLCQNTSLPPSSHHCMICGVAVYSSGLGCCYLQCKQWARQKYHHKNSLICLKCATSHLLMLPQLLIFGTIIDSETSQTALEVLYHYRNCSLKLLAILCQGLEVFDGDPVYNPRVLSWSAAEKVSNIKPNAAELKEEVIQSASKQTMTSCQWLNAWMLQHLTDWLNKHRIDREDDVSLIKKAVVERIAVVENAAKEKEKEKWCTLGRLGSAGTRKYPMLWLIHAIWARWNKEGIPSASWFIQRAHGGWKLQYSGGTPWFCLENVGKKWNDMVYLLSCHQSLIFIWISKIPLHCHLI